MSSMKTSVAYPYALVRRGGVTEGKRPCTRFAFLVEYRAGRGDYRAILINPGNGAALTKSVRVVERDNIVHAWRQLPSAAAISKVRRRLMIPAARRGDHGAA